MSDKTFVYTTYIKTTPEKLWEALTSNEFLKLYWFGSSFVTDWKKGSKIVETRDNGQTGFHGEILESNPPNHLAYTFIVPGRGESNVTYDIESHSDTVTLTVTHVGYERDSEIYISLSNGFAAILSGLKTILETGESLDKDSVENLYSKTQ